MKPITALMALLLTGMAASGASNSDFEIDLLRSGFVRGVQDHKCWNDFYVAEIVDGNLKARSVGADIGQSRITGEVRFSGKSVQYEARNDGEFGGKLEAVLKSGERRFMLKGNTQSFVPFEKDLYVFQGLSHLSMSTGSVSVIKDYDGRPQPQDEPITFLPDTPVHAALASKHRGLHWFWVVGTHSLVQVITDWHLLQVVSWEEFSVREVASFAEDDRGVVIGTCGGVIAVDVPCRRAPRTIDDRACPARFYVPKRT